jgi:DNA modification methylase
MAASGKGFMNRTWDGVKKINGETLGQAAERWHRAWAVESLRVLKPGGHLIAFSGSRTQHRMYSAIEDVGFEIRDVLQWLYGQGMPKSLDVSKAIDKADASSERRRRALEFTTWVGSLGLTPAVINEATASNMGSHYTTTRQQPRVATRDHLDAILKLAGLACAPDAIEELVGRRVVLSEQFAAREVIDVVEMNGKGGGFSPWMSGEDGGPQTVEVAITAAFSEEAKRYAGWGTALKPFYEPAVLARKPLRGKAGGESSTVAGNVLDWGTGGINVDACRIGEGDKGRWPSNVIMSHHEDCVLTGSVEDEHMVDVGPKLAEVERGLEFGFGRRASTTTTTTRDVYACHPECPAAILDAQSGIQKDGVAVNRNKTEASAPGGIGMTGLKPQVGGEDVCYGGSGGASRFLYQAKPSRGEKEIGLEHFPIRSGSDITGREEGSAGINHPRAGAGAKGGVKNTHVTVKPVELMRYLCRLVTPPGGTVLDVFAGSGTTGVAAIAEGFNFIGVELGGDDGSHLAILEGRIRHALGMPKNLDHACREWLEEHRAEPEVAAYLASITTPDRTVEEVLALIGTADAMIEGAA